MSTTTLTLPPLAPPDTSPSPAFRRRRVRRDTTVPSRSYFAPDHTLAENRSHGDLSEVEPNQFVLELQTLRRISTVRNNPALVDRHDSLIRLADETWPNPPEELRNYELGDEMEEYFYEVLLALKRALRAQGILDAETNEHLYTAELDYYTEVRETLFNLQRVLAPRLRQLGRRIPEVPDWGQNHDVSRLLTEFDFELIASRFRRDVEGFLAYLYHNADLLSLDLDQSEPEEPKGKERESGSWQDMQVEGDPIDDSLVSKDRKKHRPTPGIITLLEGKIPDEVGEGGSDETDEGFRSTRKDRADSMSKKAAESEGLKGYGEPSALTNARRFSEMWQNKYASTHSGDPFVTPLRSRSPSSSDARGREQPAHLSNQTMSRSHPLPDGSTYKVTEAKAGSTPFALAGPNSNYPGRASGSGLGPLSRLLPTAGRNLGGGQPSRGPPSGGFPGGGLPGGGPPGGGLPPGGGPLGGGPPGGGPPGGGPPGGGPPGGGPPVGGGGPYAAGPGPRIIPNVGPPILDRYGLPIDGRFQFTPEHFDRKLKPDIVSEWDGNTDNLPRWIRALNRLSHRSDIMHRQLGEIAATRLTKKAKEWFESLPLRRQDEATRDWTALRTAIAAFYMNRTWLERQKLRANKAVFRESGHVYETPSDYFIRKTELLRLVYDLSEAEIIMEVMDGAPTFWRQVIDTQRLNDSLELQLALKYHENVLIHGFTDSNENEAIKALERRLRALGITPNSPRTKEANQSFWRNKAETARTHAVGWSTNLEPPKWPKDDSTKSRGKSPKDKGARPCRHCGSELHWDYECKHAKKGAKQVRAHFVNPTDDYTVAQEAYDDLYYQSDTDDDETEALEVEVSSHRVSVQIPEEPSLGRKEEESVPETDHGITNCKGTIVDGLVELPRIADWMRSRKLTEAVAVSSKLSRTLVAVNDNPPDGEPIVLRRVCARPPGSTFLGAKATSTKALIGGAAGSIEDVIIDSGSDITLISHKCLGQLKSPPKIKAGQRINLVQVTGAASISGYVEVPLVFEADKGPVVLAVEAYVVKGMNAPFILGNDFADQYQLSIVREDSGTRLHFGDSGRSIPVQNSVRAPDETDSLAFHVSKNADITRIMTESRLHRSANKGKNRRARRAIEPWVRVAKPILLKPLSITKVDVVIPTAYQRGPLFMEGMIDSFSNEEEAFGSPDCFLPIRNPSVQIANFSPRPRFLTSGLCVGKIVTQDRLSSTKKSQARLEVTKYAHLIHALMEDSPADPGKEDPGKLEEDDELPGPKTAEFPVIETIPSDKLVESLDISDALDSGQRKRIEEVIQKNAIAFGLDGRLGNFKEGSFEIHLRPGHKEISLPPYTASPTKREVIDKQLDAWLALKVIEPSKSPWGFPVLVAYRNGKPRLCVDYRKLNELTVPDAFALPRQEDILQALTGSQWLSTFDALAGFNQLDIRKEDWEKTAFRTHRGLLQFRRLPFGLMNGPSVFQRLMQNILSPYLWLFTLVYIDDIVVYSPTFDDHVRHLDLVLRRISESGITLAPAKCHLGYQSLVLLGQKVSRLGMSTHREKIEAIVNLASPTNVHDLQTFLGMMVYFSAYVPYYAWIVTPLFALLKKGTAWKWGESEENAYQLAKEVLVSAPVRAYAIHGLGYRLYSDASNVGIACILQQVQPIKVGDLQGTKTYERLEKAYSNKEPVPTLVQPLVPEEKDKWTMRTWGEEFNETIIDVERVIAYWSRTLKPAERNYSPTEKEALALKEGLVKFQMYLEGEEATAITDHAALIWTKTFQNINRRLLTWGTTFAAYPKLKIVHRAGRIHSNVDPISRLLRTPDQIGPLASEINLKSLTLTEDDNRKIPKFSERWADLVSHDKGGKVTENLPSMTEQVEIPMGTGSVLVQYSAAKCFNLLVNIDPSEVSAFKEGYAKDSHFKIVEELLTRNDEGSSLYSRGEDNLIYFEDPEGNQRLCVPKDRVNEILSEGHNEIHDGAHSGYFKTYARIAASYYWPRMSRDVKRYVATCDVCQKTKPRRHAPYRQLHALPIPTRPFEVVTMDFIPELPTSEGYDSILVVVDKLTKYALFIPTTTTITDEGTAKLFFNHVVAHYGLPKQLVMDRDSVWANTFWKELTKLMGIRRSLSTAHHPQTDGQTEVMNQTLEIALRAYVNKEVNNWSDKLHPLMLAYNSSVHSSTGFSPAYLLRGFDPLTPARLFHSPDTSITRPVPGPDLLDPAKEVPSFIENERAHDFSLCFQGLRNVALDSLARAQAAQEKNYNKGRLRHEFEEGDKVLLNPSSLGLTKETRGRGNKLRQKYDGPFEVIGKLSPVTYRLRMPASYKIHPVINIQHLEKYQSTEDFGQGRPALDSRRADFDELPEYEVQEILGERMHKISGRRRVKEYRVRFTGYDESFDEWLTKTQLRNAPDAIADWERNKGSKRT